MRTVPRPTLGAREAFRTSISRVQDDARRERLANVEDDVAAASQAFDAAAQAHQVHSLPVVDGVGGASTDDMVWVYERQMAKKGRPGRAVYDRLLSRPAFDRCPLCGAGRVTTLDHHLPKRQYPALAVAPLNLVPACKDCNTGKQSVLPTCSEEETLHPYFDDISDERWVEAEVVHSAPASLRFSVVPPTGADVVLAARVRRHFDVFNLETVYASYGAEGLIEIQDSMRMLHGAGGARMVSDDLRGRARECERVDLNSWRSAMYRALASDGWYCDGGFEGD